MSKYDCKLNLDDRNSLSVLVERVKPNSIVLEFGPANGRMTKYMKEQLNCKVYAVEIDANAAKDAEQYTEKIIVDSIENYKWQEEFKDLQFDYIIFADVLEHLYYPEKVLKSVKEFLKEDGSIMISIPNIAHNSIIINLCMNQFNYKEVGLLDNTHIRFFTKLTFDSLISKCDYYVKYEDAIFILPINTEFANSYSDVDNLDFLKNRPLGNAYQFIYELKTKKCKKESRLTKVNNYSFFNKNIIKYNKHRKVADLKIIIEQKDNYIEELREKIDEQRITIEQKDNYIEELREKIEQKNNYIQKIQSNIFYKIYKIIKGK